MWQSLLRWIVGLFGQAALDWAYPDTAKKRDDLIAARDVQTAKDAQTKTDAAKIEDQIVTREKDVAADQKAVEQDKADIVKAQDDLAAKLKQVDDAQTIEDVLKVKP